MSRLLLRTIILLVAMVSGFHAGNAAAAAEPSAHPSVATTTALERATQALVDALAPGRTAVWEHYADPGLTYVTEDNEVKSRKQLLAEMKPLPPGASGRIAVQEFRCTDFGSFAVTTYVMDEHETVEGQELHARYRGSDKIFRARTRWAGARLRRAARGYGPSVDARRKGCGALETLRTASVPRL